jgi:hypothetical protein
MIQLSAPDQKRLAARLEARAHYSRGGPNIPDLDRDIQSLANQGWTPAMIGERFGMSAAWAWGKMHEHS